MGSSRPTEVAANGEAAWVLKVVRLALKNDAFVTIENPEGSLLWWHLGFLRLVESQKMFPVVLDQCAYGLKFPDSSDVEFCRKRTRVLTSCPQLAQRLSRRCPGCSDTHRQALDNLIVGGKSVKRSAMAGIYPEQLCSEWAAAIRATRDEGTAPQRR